MIREICFWMMITEAVVAIILVVIYLIFAGRILEAIHNITRSSARRRVIKWYSRIVVIVALTPIVIYFWPEITGLLKAIDEFRRK